MTCLGVWRVRLFPAIEAFSSIRFLQVNLVCISKTSTDSLVCHIHQVFTAHSKKLFPVRLLHLIRDPKQEVIHSLK